MPDSLPERQVMVHSLDVGYHTFEAFLDKRLEILKHDMLRECNRIAAARELVIKKKLDDTLKEKEKLKEKLRWMSKKAADAVLQLDHQQSSEAESTGMSLTFDLEGIKTLGLDNWVEAQVDAKLKSNSEDSEHFILWAEYEDVLGEEDEECERSKDSKFAFWQRWSHGSQICVTDVSDAELAEVPHSSCTLNPYSTPSICWEVLGIPVLFYDLVTIPMQVFFKSEGMFFNIIGWLLILYWTLDIFLRLLVIGYVTQEGSVDRKRRDIMKGYLFKGSFAFDMFMVMPDWFSKILGTGGLRNVAILRLFRILRLLRLMRMSKMKKMMRQLEDLIDSEYFSVAVRIFGNLFAILGVCHYLGCFWFWLGSLEGHESWVKVQNLQDAEWIYQYAASFHWALVQFTPGSSIIKPCNIFEQLAEITALIFGLVSLSLFISDLLQARSRLRALSSKMEKDNWMLRRYLRQQCVSMDLQYRTMRYVEQCVEPMMTRMQKKDVELLPLLSRPLQLEVLQEQYFHTLIAHPFFESLRQRSFGLTLHLFINVIIEILLAGADLLFESGSVAHEMFLVSRGTLGYLREGDDQVQHIHKGSWCSELVLWVAWVHNGTARASAETRVISIDSAKMRAGILEHKERVYASRCAQAYVKDLNALLRKGCRITDVTKVTNDESSAYMSIVGGELDGQLGNKMSSPEVNNVSPQDGTKMTPQVSSTLISM